MEQLYELPPFLRHENPQVRLQACQMLGGLGGSREAQEAIFKLPFVKPLRDLITDDDQKISKMAVSVMINLSEHDGLRDQMVTAGTIGVIMETLKDKKCTNKYLLMMLMSNLTIGVPACKKLMQLGSALEGLNLRMLIQWFTQDPNLHTNVPEKDRSKGKTKTPEEDPFCYMGNVLSNVTQLAEARELLVNRKRGLLQSLIPQIKSHSKLRRMGVLSAIKNIAIKEDHHEYLLSTELGLYPELCTHLVGPTTMGLDEEDRGQLLPQVQAAIQPGKRFETEPDVRMNILDIILLFCRHPPSRQVLKKTKMYFLLRELHKWELGLPEHDLKNTIDEQIESLVHYLVLEDDTEGAKGPTVEEISEAQADLDAQEAAANKQVEEVAEKVAQVTVEEEADAELVVDDGDHELDEMD